MMPPADINNETNNTAVAPRWAIAFITLLAFILPFELDTPLLQVGPVVITNVELTLGIVFLSSFVLFVRYRFHPELSRMVWGWATLFTIGLVVSTIFAATHQLNALKASLRLLSGLGLALFAIPILIRSWVDIRYVLWTALLGGIVAVALGWIEYVQNRELLWLNYFREQPTLAGGFIRLTGSFDYANQTAMFIEATAPILFCTIWYVWQKKEKSKKKTAVLILLISATILYLQAAFLTFSRTSVVSIALSSVLIAGLLWFKGSQSKRKMSLLWLGVTTVVLFLILFNAQFNDTFRLRLQTEGDNEWYNAALIVPFIEQMEINETRTIAINLKNNGSLTWRSHGQSPINLGARWINRADQESISEPRWAFANPVGPGDEVEMTVTLQAPPIPGEYELIWDVVHERITWFGAKTNQHLIDRVTVIDSGQATLPTPTGEEPSWEYPLPIPDRRTLWTTAFAMWQKRPFFGIGPDNFRLTYGLVLGASSWNETIHTNNWYIETAVSLGIVGALVVFMGLAILAFDIIRRLTDSTISIWQIGVGTGLFAFFIHGILDFFILFNATGLLFWLLVGCWLTMHKANFDLPTTQVNDHDANWI